LSRYFSGHQSLRRTFSEILVGGTKQEALRRFVICHPLLAIGYRLLVIIVCLQSLNLFFGGVSFPKG